MFGVFEPFVGSEGSESFLGRIALYLVPAGEIDVCVGVATTLVVGG
jgi:hypothetical protein